MKKPVLALILSLLFFSIPFVAMADGYTDVTVAEAKNMIDSIPSLVVLDVRTQGEYDSGHIRNARLIPHTELELRLDELDVNDQILVYCRSGFRSSIASQILIDNGFLHVYNMLGGILDWISQGYSVFIKYSSIQEAINNANDGDTILVGNGTYYEHVVVNKTVSLIGENVSTTTIDGNNSGTVVEITADNVTIEGFTIQNSGWGWIKNGIYIHSASNVKIRYNHLLHNCHNIRLNYSYGSQVIDNMVDGDGYGIRLINSINCTVISNNVSNCIGGIHLQNATECIVKQNHLTQHSQGIRLYTPCLNNRIIGNTIFNCTYDGMIEEIPPDGTLLNNSIIHNNFINNTHSFISEVSGIIWDDDCEGNFWSNYNGTDSNNDGIGDTPYIINEINIDNYPLMNLYWNPCDINHDLKVDMKDIGSAAIAFGSETDDLRWNCHADITGPTPLEPDGKINMRDIGLIARGFGETYS